MARAARQIPPGKRQAPSQQDALLRKAVARHRQGRLSEVAALCRKILKHAPDNPGALHLLGVAQLGANQPVDAAETLRCAAAADPGNVEVLANLGASLRAAGDPDAAAETLRHATALAPAFVPAWINLGNALLDAGETGPARAAYANAATLDPAHVRARRQLARLLAADGEAEAALAQLDEIIAAVADDPALHNERGLVLIDLGRPDDAVASFSRALAAAPDDPDTLSNLGNALCAAGRPEAALTHYRRALQLCRDDPDTLANSGHAHKQLGALDQAVAFYERALADAAYHREARFGRATCRLLQGDFAGGWDDYRFRETMGDGGASLRWEPLAADLTGKRVLVTRDQGLGDEIFFLRYLPRLAARGAAVEYRPDPRLADMLARTGIAIVSDDTPSIGHDLTIAVCDLPYLLSDGDDPPVAETIVLPPLPDRTEALRNRLAGFGPPPYVGITWRAGTRNRHRLLFKESPIDRLAAMLAPVDARVVILQRAPAGGEIDAFRGALGRDALDLSGLNDDLEDMLALVGLLDEQICPSNTNVHLAAARGRTCRVLVPHPPEFRWMAAGAESPWFPGMPVYRQQADGDWDPAFAALAADLARRG